MDTATVTIRANGPGAYLVQSSDGETWYQVRLAPERCQCKGFQYRSKCRHVTAVVEWYAEHPLDLEEPADDEPEDEDEDVEVSAAADLSETSSREVTMACTVYSEMCEGAELGRNTEPSSDEELPQEASNALQDRAERPTMSTLRMPSLPQIDEAQRMRDARTVVLQRVISRNVDQIFDTFVESLKAVCNDPNHPLAQMFADLEFGPMEDRFDLDGWLKYAPTRDKVQLGEAIMRAAGEAQLVVVEKLLDQAF